MMNPRIVARSERGIALPLALISLLILSVLLVGLLAVARTEPSISGYHRDWTQALQLANAGVERAFDVLATDQNWSGHLRDTSVAAPWRTLIPETPLPELTEAWGTFEVTIRNDSLIGDTPITGEPEDRVGDTPTDTDLRTDRNGIVIVRATGKVNAGTANEIQRTIQVVFTKPMLIKPKCVLCLTGEKNITSLGSGRSHNHFDGRDYKANGENGKGPNIYAILAPNQRWRDSVWADMNVTYDGDGRKEICKQGVNCMNGHQTQELDGRSSNGPLDCNPCKQVDRWADQGKETVAIQDAHLSVADRLTQSMIESFVNKASFNPHVSYRIKNASQAKTLNNVGANCGGAGWQNPNCWGSESRPKIIYIDGTPENPDADYTFSHVTLTGNFDAYGLILVRNAHIEWAGDVLKGQHSNFRGLIVAFGDHVGIRFAKDEHFLQYGSTIVHELMDEESDPGSDEVQVATNRHGNGDEDYRMAWQFVGLSACDECVTKVLRMRRLVRNYAFREVKDGARPTPAVEQVRAREQIRTRRGHGA